jgi:hypothetical protein
MNAAIAAKADDATISEKGFLLDCMAILRRPAYDGAPARSSRGEEKSGRPERGGR